GLASQLVAKDGSVRPLEATVPGAGRSASTLGAYDEVSGHNVPAVFTEWMAQTGTVLQGGRLAQGRLMDPLFVLGRPITEAYWADVLVAGAPARVLVQLFERRSLTYNPANPPQWQVEMANVGRAYYDWHYGGAAPDPAISVQVTPSGVRVRGWNWLLRGPNLYIGDRLGGRVAGPFGPMPEKTGIFSVLLPVDELLEKALLSGDRLFVAAGYVDGTTALPLVGKIPIGDTVVEGMLTAIHPGPYGGSYLVLIKADTGKEWQVSLYRDVTTVLYSEGGEAQVAQLASGEYVRVEGRMGGNLIARTIRLMSLSQTGAQLGYELAPSGRAMRLSGTNWPPGRDILFSVRPFLGDAGVLLGSARSDSRGNLAASFELSASRFFSEPLWLFGQVQQQGRLVAQVAVLFQPGDDAYKARDLASLTLLGSAGEQMGEVGSHCHVGKCEDVEGVPVPGDMLPVKAGEVLGLRSQSGPDRHLGLVPQRFTAQLYAYPSQPEREGTIIDDTYYFSPKSLPVFSTGEVPGRPFSVSLPATLTGGHYYLLVSVVWSEGAAQREEAVYGFALQLPRQEPPLSR
nr:hypothetical protein [Chloroflexota bacterium]